MFSNTGLGQHFNNNPDFGYINHNVPKSPESASFEKYGKIPMGEYTGTSKISIPLYNIQTKDLDIPLNLHYHASGIKVSQEATRVGLGWDLIPGGRISLEIRGGNDQLAKQFTGQQVNKNILTYLFYIGKQGSPYSEPLTGVNKAFSAKYDILYQLNLGNCHNMARSSISKNIRRSWV